MTNTQPFDPATLLQTEEDMLQAITDALNEDDPNILMLTLNDIAKIKGTISLSKVTGLTPESLYQTLSGKTQAEWNTVHKIIVALGIRLQAVS